MYKSIVVTYKNNQTNDLKELDIYLNDGWHIVQMCGMSSPSVTPNAVSVYESRALVVLER